MHAAPHTTATVGTPAPPVCTCTHLVTYFARHPQTEAGAAATASAALTTVSTWLGGGSAAAALRPAIPTHAPPTTELQALLHFATTLDEERRTAAMSTRLQSMLPRCSTGTCQQGGGINASSLLACLECTHVGCWAPATAVTGASGVLGTPPPVAHSRQHAQERHHSLALDLSRLTVYCFACNDCVYHPAIERLLHTIRHDTLARKRRREQLEMTSTARWPPATAKLFHDRVRWIGADQHAGLRGMYNLGNTCFMSVVLQTLIHNPLLRNYFLSDLHNAHRCTRRQKTSATSSGSTGAAPSVCLACDMDEVFSTFYSGDHAPFLPDHLLYSMWTHAEHLAGYQQQDAHECLMAILDGIHAGCADHAQQTPAATAPPPLTNAPNAPNPSPAPCRCIIQTVFGGSLRSDVQCQTCHHVSTTSEATLDLSLQLNLDATHSQPTAKRTGGTIDLVDCLARFTRAEKLTHADNKFFCSRCQRHEEATKSMTFERLPLVLCLHLKRFDHSARIAGGAISNSSTKIEQYVAFPLSDLDMAPYLHASSAATPSSTSISLHVHHGSTRYSCFCVVVHKGTLDTGHYLCYVRAGATRDQWYRMDDRHCTLVDASEVLACNASVQA